MIYLIYGASHSGKTLVTNELVKRLNYNALSIDLLKMGLIRSNMTSLRPEDDEQLKDYLWPIVREMIKTAIENNQNLIIEGLYIKDDWRADFTDEYLAHVKAVCLIMDKHYIQKNFNTIITQANVIEERLSDDLNIEEVIKDNVDNLSLCKDHQYNYFLIKDSYNLNAIIEYILSV